MANRDHLFDPHFHSISPVQEDYPMGKGGQRFEPEPAGSPGPNTFSFTDRAGASKDQLQNTHNPYQSSPGPTRTGHTSNLDRGMFGGSDARATDRWPGPGLDPLTPAPPLTSHFRPLALHSMVMVIPETTAGTHAKKSTEQNGTPVQRIPPFRPPHGTGTVNLEREMAQEDVRELCSLVTRWKKLCKLVFLNVALTHIVQYIPTVREAVYDKPRLAVYACQQNGEVSAGAKREREKRAMERQCLEELSRYYRLAVRPAYDGDEAKWVRKSLIKEVLQDLKFRYPPPELSTVGAAS